MRIQRLIPPVLLFLLLIGTAAFSQGPPLIAVLPLQALGELNAEQVGTVTRLLETGLVKSSIFQVLERNEIAQVLAAQEYSAEECFDENCAVRLGRLLAARLIVLGTLSRAAYPQQARAREGTSGAASRAGPGNPALAWPQNGQPRALWNRRRAGAGFRRDPDPRSEPARGSLRRSLVRLQPKFRGPQRRRGGGRHGSLAGTAGSGKHAGAD
jgi:hypothetical protein